MQNVANAKTFPSVGKWDVSSFVFVEAMCLIFLFLQAKLKFFIRIRSLRFFLRSFHLSISLCLSSLISFNSNIVLSISKYDFSFVFVFVNIAQICFKWIYIEIHSVLVLLSFCLIYTLSFGLALAKYKSPSFILFCLKRTSKNEK